MGDLIVYDIQQFFNLILNVTFVMEPQITLHFNKASSHSSRLLPFRQPFYT